MGPAVTLHPWLSLKDAPLLCTGDIKWTAYPQATHLQSCRTTVMSGVLWGVEGVHTATLPLTLAF